MCPLECDFLCHLSVFFKELVVSSRLERLAYFNAKRIESKGLNLDGAQAMLDTMTLTKILGGFCGSLLIFLLGSWAAEEIYHASGHGAHGEEHAPGYAIYIEEYIDEVEEEDEGDDFSVLLASADMGKGAKVFGKCKACHKLEDGAKGTGPHLYQIVDRDVAAVDGYGYSGALIAVADVWTIDALNGFLENPKSYAPGTKMGFAGLKKPEDRANLIAYLQSVE